MIRRLAYWAEAEDSQDFKRNKDVSGQMVLDATTWQEGLIARGPESIPMPCIS